MTTVTTILDDVERTVTHDVPIHVDGVPTETVVIAARSEDAGTIEGPFGQWISLGSKLVDLRINGVECERYEMRFGDDDRTILITTIPKEGP
jgi:hypothetical protein